MHTEFLYSVDINKFGKNEKGKGKKKKRKVHETTNQKTADCKKNENPQNDSL